MRYSLCKGVFIISLIFINFFAYNTSYAQASSGAFIESLITGSNFTSNLPTPNDERIIRKYSDHLQVDQGEIIANLSLYRNIESWIGTKYQWGGCNRSGIDCSCFVQTLYKDVYGIKIDRTSNTQFKADEIDLFRNRNEIKLGDLVFFKTAINRETRNMPVTHVGFYLTNGYFVQSSSSGVNIAKLFSGYWKDKLVAAGRMRKFAKLKQYAIISDNERKRTSDVVLKIDDVNDKSQLGSIFNPVTYSQDYEATIASFSNFLRVDKAEIAILPEVYDFIEKNRLNPLALTNSCTNGESLKFCIVKKFFEQVYGFTETKTGIGLGNSIESLVKEQQFIENKKFRANLTGDIVQVKYTENGKPQNTIGIYLVNNNFLHLHNDTDLVITQLAYYVGKNATIKYYAAVSTVNNKGLEYVESTRRNVGKFIPWNQDSLNNNPTEITPEGMDDGDGLPTTSTQTTTTATASAAGTMTDPRLDPDFEYLPKKAQRKKIDDWEKYKEQKDRENLNKEDDSDKERIKKDEQGRKDAAQRKQQEADNKKKEDLKNKKETDTETEEEIRERVRKEFEQEKKDKEARDRAAKEEQDRKAKDAQDKRERARIEQEERDRIAKEDQDRIAKDAQDKRERARIEQEERNRIAKEEQDRKEKDAQDKRERARIEKEERDRAAKEEQDRIAKEAQARKEQERKDKAEKDRIAKEDQDRKAKAEKERIEQERNDKIEKARIAKEEKERKDNEQKMLREMEEQMKNGKKPDAKYQSTTPLKAEPKVEATVEPKVELEKPKEVDPAINTCPNPEEDPDFKDLPSKARKQKLNDYKKCKEKQDKKA